MTSTIGEAVRRTRLDQGMTQEQLASAIGVTQPRLSAIERGDTPPGLPQIQAIEKALGVKAGHVLRAAGQIVPEGEVGTLDYVEVSARLQDAIDALQGLARSLGMRADVSTEREEATQGKPRKKPTSPNRDKAKAK